MQRYRESPKCDDRHLGKGSSRKDINHLKQVLSSTGRMAEKTNSDFAINTRHRYKTSQSANCQQEKSQKYLCTLAQVFEKRVLIRLAFLHYWVIDCLRCVQQ